jgi:hypothetical protein
MAILPLFLAGFLGGGLHVGRFLLHGDLDEPVVDADDDDLEILEPVAGVAEALALGPDALDRDRAVQRDAAAEPQADVVARPVAAEIVEGAPVRREVGGWDWPGEQPFDGEVVVTLGERAPRGDLVRVTAFPAYYSPASLVSTSMRSPRNFLSSYMTCETAA